VRAGDSSASSEIYQTDPSGEPRLLVARDKPGSVLESPEWTPDGGTLYFSFSALENQRVVRRIERLGVATGARSPVTDGLFPSISPDGAQMAFIRPESGGDSLVLSHVDGQNGRVLIPSGRYSALATARFSPDGRTLAIPISSPTHAARERTPSSPFGTLGPPVAYAHGDLWDVYLLDLSGGEPRRLTRLLDDEINIAWSPDGSQLAVYGSRGLHLAALDGKTTFALDRGGYGGIDWTR
jgi:Tol biopolymer transport system component